MEESSYFERQRTYRRTYLEPWAVWRLSTPISRKGCRWIVQLWGLQVPPGISKEMLLHPTRYGQLKQVWRGSCGRMHPNERKEGQGETDKWESSARVVNDKEFSTGIEKKLGRINVQNLADLFMPPCTGFKGKATSTIVVAIAAMGKVIQKHHCNLFSTSADYERREARTYPPCHFFRQYTTDERAHGVT